MSLQMWNSVKKNLRGISLDGRYLQTTMRELQHDNVLVFVYVVEYDTVFRGGGCPVIASCTCTGYLVYMIV